MRNTTAKIRRLEEYNDALYLSAEPQGCRKHVALEPAGFRNYGRCRPDLHSDPGGAASDAPRSRHALLWFSDDPHAAYQLGKIYLYGKKVERDDEKAIAYLSVAAEHGNSYAEQLLHSIRSNRNWSVSLGAIQLLQHLSRLIQNQLDDEKKGKAGAIDRKLKRKIDEKKQAHGLKQG